MNFELYLWPETLASCVAAPYSDLNGLRWVARYGEMA